MFIKKRLFYPALFFFLLSSPAVFAIPVDLTTFATDFPDNVTVATDGSEAFFTENDVHAPINLWNDLLPLPDTASYLSFNYELLVPVGMGNEDYFHFYFIDDSVPEFIVGGPDTGAIGSYSRNVQGLAGQDVYMNFAFTHGFLGDDASLNSTLRIFNVEIVERQIPIPSTILLVMGGLIGLLGIKKKN